MGPELRPSVRGTSCCRLQVANAQAELSLAQQRVTMEADARVRELELAGRELESRLRQGLHEFCPLISLGPHLHMPRLC